MYLVTIVPYLASGSVIFVHDGNVPFLGGRFIATPGCFPEHMFLKLSADSKTLIVTCDVWTSCPYQLQSPEWGFAPEKDRERSGVYDQDRTAEDERKESRMRPCVPSTVPDTASRAWICRQDGCILSLGSGVRSHLRKRRKLRSLSATVLLTACLRFGRIQVCATEFSMFRRVWVWEWQCGAERSCCMTNPVIIRPCLV